MEYYAHIVDYNGKRINQNCKSHLEKTAIYTAHNLESINMKYTGFIMGILHDMGKMKEEYSIYLKNAYEGKNVSRGSVNHSSAGCIWLLENYVIPIYGEKQLIPLENAWAAELMAYVIASHHGVLDCIDENGVSCFEKRIKGREDISYEETIKNYFSSVIQESSLKKAFQIATGEIQKIICNIAKDGENRAERDFQMGMLTRLLLSSLIDADWQDSMEFMTQTKSLDSYRNNKKRQEFWKRQLQAYEDKINRFSENSPINCSRNLISKICNAKAYEQNGIYRLSVPTGAGKTLASLRYALQHASQYNKKRIIFVIPLLAVLEQNSKVIREYICDSEEVLEHHSNVIVEGDDDRERYQLLTENWKSPIIITTMVQFMNTLFSEKKSSVRRMQALCDSVIIIDEVQSIPLKLLSMFNEAMNFLKNICHCSIVLCSATQPSLAELKHKIHYEKDADIVVLEKKEREKFRRTIVWDSTDKHGISIHELVDFSLEKARQISSLLIICNTKSTALQLFEEMQLRGDVAGKKLFLMSASMCQQHREDVMIQMRRAMEFQNVICVATQVMEAGVDISFECVIRVVAGIDNIVQAAGRCNRNFEFEQMKDTYIVKLRRDNENLRCLPDIRHAQNTTLNLLEQLKRNQEIFENDLLSDFCIKRYYEQYYMDCKPRHFDYPIGSENTLFEWLSKNELREQMNQSSSWHNLIIFQSFKEAWSRFNVFDEDTIDTIVPYNKEAKDIICDMNSDKAQHDLLYLKNCINRAKKYTIHLFEFQQRMLGEMGMLKGYCNNHVFTLNEQCYDSQRGLNIPGDMFF